MRIFLFILCLNCLIIHAQEIDSATVATINKYQFGGIYKSSVSANLGGVTGFGGITYDYFMSDRWRLEAGVGYYSIGFGFDFYPWPIQREFSRFKINFRNSLFWPISANIMFHSLGCGMTHFFIGRWNLGFDVGVSYIHSIDELEPFDWVKDDFYGAWPVYPHINVKFGYRFSFGAWKRKRELEQE